jgi:hypothetical protein
MNIYMAGALVTVSASFIDNETSALADPTTVTLSTCVNRGVPTVYTYGTGDEIVRTAVGEYTANLDTTAKPGKWTYEWIGTGAVQAIDADWFDVEPAPI